MHWLYDFLESKQQAALAIAHFGHWLDDQVNRLGAAFNLKADLFFHS